MSFFLRISITFFFSSIVCSTYSYAQHLNDSINNLSEIIIKKKPSQDIIPVQTLQGKEIERLNAHSVADALRYFSGVQIKDYGGLGGLKTVDVRNMGSHHVGVFYNGQQINNAQNGIVDLGKFSLDNIEAVALYNGQRTDIFQSATEYASGSTLYIYSKEPWFAPGKPLQIKGKYKAGSIQLSNPSLQLNYQLSPFLKTSISGEYISSNGRYEFRQKKLNTNGTVAYDTIGTRLNGDIQAYRIENNWFYKKDNDELTVNLYYYQSDRGLPGAIIKKSDHTIATENINERQGDKNVITQATWTKYFSAFYNLKIKAKYSYDQTHFLSRKTVDFEGDQVTYNPQFDNTFYQQNYFASMAHLFNITAFWKASFSSDIKYEKLNATRIGQGALFTYPQRFTFYNAIATSIEIGAVKLQANLLSTTTHEKVRYNYKAPNRQVWNPSLFINYKPFNYIDLDLFAYYKESYRLPTFNDLYYTNLGTANLLPEQAKQITIGASYSHSFQKGIVQNFRINAQTYIANITNKIIASPTSSMGRWMMTNLGKVESSGIEADASIALIPFEKVTLQFNLSYAYTIAMDKSVTPAGPTSYYGDQIPYTPWNSGSFITTLLWNDYSLNYSFIYVGSRYNGNRNNIKRNEIQPWYTNDISISKSFTIKEHQFKATLQANNIANQYYEVVSNYPMPGRNYTLTINFEL